MLHKFKDGLINFVNQLANSRSSYAQNSIVATKLNYADMNECFKTGLGQKIIHTKVSYALNDSLQFKNEANEIFYNKKLFRSIKKASKYALAFGRGIIVINDKSNLSQPLTNLTSKDWKLEVFSGDMVTIGDVSRDLNSPRYMKPLSYNVNGITFHWSRVVDFLYVEPIERDLPNYQYGGISEFELIYNQLINDGVVERASATIVDKNSTVFYKMKGFKEALQQNKETDILRFVGILENARSIYGAGIIDSEDDVQSVAQTLTNLSETDQITLRRLAMVTGIPLAILVGESVRGINSTGEQERTTFQDMIENLQFDYLLEPIQKICGFFGFEVEFKENQGGTANDRIDFETKVIDNSIKLAELGEDYRKYMKDNGIILDNVMSMFSEEDDGEN